MKPFYLSIILIVALHVSVIAQNKINQYEYWFDDNDTTKVLTSITPASTLHLINSISTSALNNGLHTFHIRFRDDSSRYSSVLSQFFQKIPATTAANRNIIAYEYWYDNNYAGKVMQSVSPQNEVAVLTSISDSSLPNGLHTFHIRFKDSDNMWSSVLSQFFQKIPAVTPANRNIIAYEYWYDNNYAGKVMQSVSPQNEVAVLTSISDSTLPNGLHTFHIRFKDSDNMWSSVLSQFFQKIPATTAANRNIIAYEYWYDNNYAGKVMQSVSPQSGVEVLTSISDSSLPNGLHTFHIHFKDSDNMWSSVLSQFFQKFNQSSSIPNLITAYRYWIDTLFTSTVFVNLSTPTNPYHLLTTISMTQINKGNHTINFQFLDTLNQWSIVLTDTFYKNPLPIALFSANTTTLCDSGLVSFINSSIDGDIYIWNFGDGNMDTTVSPSHNYTTSGVYNVTLIAKDTATGLDSTIILNNYIKVVSTPSNSVTLYGNDSICFGQSVTLCADSTDFYLWSNGQITQSIIVSTSGNYSVTVSDVNGCSDTSSPITITVNSLPIVSLVLNPDTGCINIGTYALTGGSPSGGTYSGTGVSGGNFNPNEAGVGAHNIIYTYTDVNGCTDTSSTATIMVNSLPIVSLVLNPDTVCINIGTYALTGGSPSGGTYSGTGVNGGNFNPSEAGVGAHNIIYTYTDVNGCTDTSSTATIMVNSLPIVSLVLNPDTVCINIGTYALTGGSPSGGTYSGTGVNGGYFNPSEVGEGAHNIIYTYTDGNNCTNSDTAQIYVDLCTNIQTILDNQSILIFPNPTNGIFTIKSSTPQIIGANIIIINVLGKRIYSAQINYEKTDINLEKQAKAVYFYEIKKKKEILKIGKIIIE